MKMNCGDKLYANVAHLSFSCIDVYVIQLLHILWSHEVRGKFMNS